MRKINVVVLLVRQLQHGFTKNAKVSPNLTVAVAKKINISCVCESTNCTPDVYAMCDVSIPNLFSSLNIHTSIDIYYN